MTTRRLYQSRLLAVPNSASLLTVDTLSTLTTVYDTIDALKAAPVPARSGYSAKVLGFYAIQDADLPMYLWDATSGRNDPLAIKPNSVTGTGRWLLQSATYHVDYFGARVNVGLWDSSGIIQTAIDYLSSKGGGTLKFKSGTYTLFNSLNIPSNIALIGDNTTLRFYSQISGLVINKNADNILIENFTLRSDRVTYAGTLNCGITTAEYGNNPGGNTNIEIRNCIVENWGGPGILILGSAVAPSDRILIKGNTIRNVGAHGIICQDFVSNSTMIQNHVSDFGLAVLDRPGITAGRDGANCIVNENFVNGAGATGLSAHGISLDTTISSVCCGNIVINSFGFGIEVGFVDGGTFNNNTIRDCTSAGMAFSGTGNLLNKNIVCSGNSVVRCQKGISSFINSPNGINFHENLVLTNNTITDSQSTNQLEAIGIDLQYVIGATMVGNIIRNSQSGGVYIHRSNMINVQDNLIMNNNTTLQVTHGGIRVINDNVAPYNTFTTVNIGADNIIQGNGIADRFP